MTEGISSISGKNSTNREKRLLIGATYANVRSWDIWRKKTLRLFDRVHKDSKWQKLFSRGHYNDYWFIYLWGSSWKLFLCSRAGGEKGGREGLDLWGDLCTHSSQILAFHLTSGGRDKSPQPPSKHWHSSLVVLLPDAPWSVPGIVPWSEPGPRRLLRIVCISTPWWVLLGTKEVFKLWWWQLSLF